MLIEEKSVVQAKDYRELRECRVCKSRNLTPYLNLGDMPLVNKVLAEKDIHLERKYPLNVVYCNDCGLSQLSIVVEPDVLFRNYVYRSSISDSFSRHCDGLAEEMNYELMKSNDLVVDIGSNDGCLLKFFKQRGNRVLGVDPSINIAKIANESGIETIPEFWDVEVAKKILATHGPAKVINASNVFAHVDDTHQFFEAVRILLDAEGFFTIEFPHLYNLMEKTEFDTVYHEHLSYFLIKPIEKLAKEHGLRIAKARKLDLHGGSLRLYLEKINKADSSDGSVQRVIEEEEKAGLYNVGAYRSLTRQVDGLKNNLVAVLRELKLLGKKTCGFGASAKGNILLNHSGIGRELIGCIFDDTPEKQGKLYPGVHIPILSRNLLKEINPDYLLLLSWNFAKEMMDKTKEFHDTGGKYIIPVPHLRII